MSGGLDRHSNPLDPRSSSSSSLSTTDIDVVWLKKDVRLHDHGPITEVLRTTTLTQSSLLSSSPSTSASSARPFILLYLFEPDQLREKTVHGSHVLFAFEGLVDLEQKLQNRQQQDRQHEYEQCITMCHNTAVDTLEWIHNHQSSKYRIARLLAHEETGHWQSYMRDRQVRRFCKQNSIPFVEFNQTGVTRCLMNRDDFSKNFHACITARPEYPVPNIQALRQRLIHISDLPGTILFREHQEVTTNDYANINNKISKYRLDLDIFQEIPIEHRCDRRQRQQRGGETKALSTLDSFLQERGSKYSQDISSPSSSWNSCSRLSPYLTFGHVSLRHVIKALERRQEAVRRLKSQGRNTGMWLRSLQAFSSRLHFRSHFIQKLETEPYCQFRDFCPSFQQMRRQEGDWNEMYYDAWMTGTTGFPFVDACQRCLLEHGWINFRMRAMLVSFATYNLWLDWTKISSHLARVFLDYEPGIHYPQLQMQAGTTGINAMRVYNVTKQGKDQDSSGMFIRKYVSELCSVPDQYIHEPWKMTKSVQLKYKTIVGGRREDFSAEIDEGCAWYPAPIVNEQESARVAKVKITAIRKEQSTKDLAKNVYIKHGSRSKKSSDMNGRSAMVDEIEGQKQGKQLRINELFSRNIIESTVCSDGRKGRLLPENDQSTITNTKRVKHQSPAPKKGWACSACTFWNDNPYRLLCSMCSTKKTSN